MLTGPELGAAIEAAIKLKGITKSELARHFGVKPPSIQDWVKHGRISKTHINELVSYFSDVVTASHWGLTEMGAEQGIAPQPPHSNKTDSEPDRIAVLERQNAEILRELKSLRAQLERVVAPPAASSGDNFRTLPDAPIEAIETLKGLIDKGGEVGEDDRPPRLRKNKTQPAKKVKP